MDSSKVQSIIEWPKLRNIKALHAFLGLTGYYKKCVAYYDLIAKPLLGMLKSSNFIWTPKSEDAFIKLKETFTSTPVLALLNFSLPFIIETDVSGTGIGVILQQQRHPISFLSKSLSARNQALSVYEKEMLVVLFTADKWRHHLLGQCFTILTDHKILKHLLDQRITTPAQYQWLSKLLGYNYILKYKAG